MDRGKGSFLGAFSMLAGVPAEALARAVRRAQPMSVRRREALWAPGDPVEHLFFVRSGVARIAVPVDTEHRLTLSYHGKGDLLGEGGCVRACTGEAVRRHTVASAHEDLVVYALPIHELRRLTESSPEVARQLAQLVAERRARIEQRLGTLPYQSVPARVATMLLELAERFGVRDSRGVIVNLRLTHRQLASLVGATRETVSTVLAEFRRAGWVEVESKRVVLLDRDHLKQEAGAA